MKLLLTLLLLVAITVCRGQTQFKTIDDLANSSILLWQPTSKVSGTGTLIKSNGKYFILTASHVVKSFDEKAKIVIHLPEDKPKMIDLLLITKGHTQWQIHPVADLAVIQVYPYSQNGFDTLLTKYCFSDDDIFTGHGLPRDLELTFFGYPVVEANLVHFSALSFHGTLASGLITQNRADTNTPCDFFFMNIPSMQGCSGSGVFYNILKPIMIGGSDRTWMLGVVHGTTSDTTGGKIALITPLSYLNGWNIQTD